MLEEIGGLGPPEQQGPKPIGVSHDGMEAIHAAPEEEMPPPPQPLPQEIPPEMPLPQEIQDPNSLSQKIEPI